MFAAIGHGDIALLFVLLAVLAFGLAIYCAVTRRIVEAVVLAFVGVVLLII